MNLCSRTIIGFAFVIASLILVMYSVYHADRKKVDAQEWVEHTYNVISKANQLHKNIIDMETGQRGFLITGKHNFLKPYEDGKKNYKNGINKLYDLISDNPSQQKKIADIDKSINDWLEKAAYPEIKVRNNINYTKKNYQKIAEILSKETGKELMDRIRIQISIFTEYEKELLALRQTRNKKNISQLNTVIIWGTILGLFTGILSMIVTVRNIYHQVGGDPAKVKYFTESISKGEWKTILPENIVEAKGILSSVLKMGKIIKDREQQKDDLINKLSKALDEVKELKGIIPICSYCKNIRSEKGDWNRLEKYISEHSSAEFSHGICPECYKEQMANLESE